MMLESIQIFACDHRKDVKWDLPYIRIGSSQSDSLLCTKNDKDSLKFDPLLSEGSQMIYVAKHINDFGNPDLIGFQHYRRFFSFYLKNPIVNISKISFEKEMCATQLQILQFINNNNLDGIAPIPFDIVDENEHKFVNIIDQLKYLMNPAFGCSNEIIEKAFNIFLLNSGSLKNDIENTFTIKQQFVCNIFVLKKELFLQYYNIFFPTFVQLLNEIPKNNIKSMFPRFMGYILERFTSCYLHMLINTHKKIAICPLLTVDAHIHEKWYANPS